MLSLMVNARIVGMETFLLAVYMVLIFSVQNTAAQIVINALR